MTRDQPSREALEVLVAIAKPEVSHLIVSLLREINVSDVTTVASLDHATLQFRHAHKSFTLVICDRLGEGGHLELVTFVRWKQKVLAPSLPIICVGSQWTGTELLANRDAGATATLALPITKHALKMAVESSTSGRREFVTAPTFRGLNRRIAVISGYKGPFRRASDGNANTAQAAPQSEAATAPGSETRDKEPQATAGFGWSKAIETGRDDIDSQHRGIVDIMNDLNSAPEADDEKSERVQKSLAALKDYVGIHFAHEEQLMDAFDYSEKDNHKNAHIEFSNKLHSLDAANMKTAALRRTLLTYIYDWLISHITGIDRIMIAQLNGEYGAAESDPYEHQTMTVIDDAHKIARQIQTMSVKLSDTIKASVKASLLRRIAEATERLINLMDLACTRIEVRGCSTFQLRRLGDVRAAVNSNADHLAAAAAGKLISYCNGILSRRQGIPLGITAILSRKTERIQSLVTVIGGMEAMAPSSRAAVDEAMRISHAVHALALKSPAELIEFSP